MIIRVLLGASLSERTVWTIDVEAKLAAIRNSIPCHVAMRISNGITSVPLSISMSIWIWTDTRE